MKPRGTSLRKTRRIITRACIFLLLGAIVNVAVAWGCVRWVETEPTGVWHPNGANWLPADSELLEWYKQSSPPKGHVGQPRNVQRWSGFGVNKAMINIRPVREDLATVDTTSCVWRHRAGWPFRSAEMRIWVNVSSEVRTELLAGPLTRAKAENLREKSTETTLVVRWPGLTINTVFYAVILWLPICGPSVLRPIIRRRRGRCIKCDYDLRGDLDAGCPECGWNREEADTS